MQSLVQGLSILKSAIICSHRYDGADMLTKVVIRRSLKYVADSLAWLSEGGETLHDVGRGVCWAKTST